MKKKFLKLIESNLTRATRGGFLVGDYVEFVKGYKSHPEYKELHDQVKEAIKGLDDSKLNLRVVGINDMAPARYYGNADAMNGKVILSIAADQGGGRRYDNVLAPACLFKTIEHYPNQAPFPDQFRYDNKEILQPQEVGEVESGHGFEYSLPKKNVKLKVEKKSKPYTTQYLDGLK